MRVADVCFTCSVCLYVFLLAFFSLFDIFNQIKAILRHNRQQLVYITLFFYKFL